MGVHGCTYMNRIVCSYGYVPCITLHPRTPAGAFGKQSGRKVTSTIAPIFTK